MLDTLTSSRSGGGGIDKPPAPPSYDDDTPWERKAIEAANAAAVSPGYLEKTAPFLAYLALPRAVFGVDRPLEDAVTPFGRERFDTIHSAN